MASLNKVILIGHLGKDPEVRYTSGGLAIASFSIATSENWANKNGEKETRTEWHRIVAFGKLGEICGEYLSRGKQIYIEGRLQTREWDDKEGIKRYTTEIVADKMLMLGGKGREDNPPTKGLNPINGHSEHDIPDDDIPF